MIWHAGNSTFLKKKKIWKIFGRPHFLGSIDFSAIRVVISRLLIWMLNKYDILGGM